MSQGKDLSMTGRFAARGASLLVAVTAIALVAADWRQFRGPGGSGSSTATGLPVEWDASDQGRRIRAENASFTEGLLGHGSELHVVGRTLEPERYVFSGNSPF